MNKSNTYIFIYSTVMVVLVAALLALAATVLKPFQQKNLEIAKKLEILHAVDKGWDAGSADNKNKYVESEYDKYIAKTFVLNPAGDTIADRDAFEVDATSEMKKDSTVRVYPVFLCTKDDGSKNFIFPVRGKGLWGPIWGYVAIGDDMNTITGVFFDHQGETPGLGAEINTRWFQKQFLNKKIFDEAGAYISVKVLKNNEAKIPDHSVDAISGGTITSKGLEATIFDSMKNYLPFINKHKQ
ncbi:MAG: NADH:ubiquinone reductase (Na(+)-transporting) subunit C [Porphyromonadaceae bacterium]|nr:MAG: NADH:ubiquinone reductase (Na(+)-transporting) subunit C [Porphyromonadaceae bacterium]